MARFYKAFIFFLSLPIILYPQSQDIKFERLTSYEGLSNNQVRCLVQDDKGFMWFGTQNGLYKYDGYKFNAYYHDPGDPHSISYNWIHSMYKDKAGILWIGTFGGGLNKFDTKRERFVRYQHEINNTYSLCDNYIMDIYEDHRGDLWISTYNGLSRMINSYVRSDSQEVMFSNYKNNPSDSSSLSHNLVWKTYESNDSTIWVGTDDGCVNRFDRNSKKFTREIYAKDIYNFWNLANRGRLHKSIVYISQQPFDGQNVLTIGANFGIYKYDFEEKKFLNFDMNLAQLMNKKVGEFINDYIINEDGLIWAASTNGCYIVNSKNYQLMQCKMNRTDSKILSYGEISDIYEDRQGIVWIGSLGGGINTYDKKKQKFRHNKIEVDTIYYNVTAISEDFAEEGSILWLGTKKHGLLKYDRTTKQIKSYKGKITHIITAICQSEDNLNHLWIGTRGDGLYLFNKKTESFTKCIYHKQLDDLTKDQNRINRFSSLFLTSILIDKKGKLWLGSLGGLYKFDPQKNKYTAYLHDPTNTKSISSNDVSAICESNYGTESVLWIGTRAGGLNKLDIESGKFVSFKHDPGDSSSLNTNYVSSMLEDESGTLWIGTPRGLNQYNRSDNTFTHIMDKEKKLNAEVQSILADKSGNLWMNTMSGLHKFEPKTRNLRTYGGQFSRWAYHKSTSGEIFLASGSNLITFNPDFITDNSYIPPVVLTDFQIFNETVKVGAIKKSPLQKSISETDHIILSHEQSVFSFEFAALDYSDPSQNKYAHKMEGVDPDWVYTDASRRFATYTQLDPGEYIFRVKGSNNDGIWNEEGTSIIIIITPPWWKTNLAYTIYIFLVGFIVFGIWRFQTNRLKLQHELELEHVHAQKLEEVDHMKTRFFTNISHEFRTPLTLIIGPVKNVLAGEYGGNISELYRMIIRNGERLLQLINQILDLSKLESGHMALQVTKTDLIKFIKGLILSFCSLAERKKITLKIEIIDKDITGYIDRDKVEKIVNNLLSNAFKFTLEGGMVIFECGLRNADLPYDLKSKILEISISNTGTGIPSDQLDKIFDRFYRVNESGNQGHMGSGIGLALTKELVEVCRGEISVSSIPNKSTTFIVTLPVGKEYFKEDELSDTPFSPSLTEGDSLVALETEKHLPINQKRQADKSVPLLLIVEDNPDVTSYICSFMENDYRIITAENGVIGVKEAFKKYPDLIISDIMMPEMDGFELCEKLKSDERTSHIPVILLTAKADLNSKIVGLEFGADDYISKPFEADELKVRSKNLIEQRKKLREKFTKMIDVKPKVIATTSMDEQFLQRLLTIFEDHISEPDFSTEDFAREVGISRMNLNRKLQALTNQSTHEFIRSLRLKRAAQLLKMTAGPIFEVAYQVGFTNTSHFAKAFRNMYGQSPSAFSEAEKYQN